MATQTVDTDEQSSPTDKERQEFIREAVRSGFVTLKDVVEASEADPAYKKIKISDLLADMSEHNESKVRRVLILAEINTRTTVRQIDLDTAHNLEELLASSADDAPMDPHWPFWALSQTSDQDKQ